MLLAYFYHIISLASEERGMAFFGLRQIEGETHVASPESLKIVLVSEADILLCAPGRAGEPLKIAQRGKRTHQAGWLQTLWDKVIYVCTIG